MTEKRSSLIWIVAAAGLAIVVVVVSMVTLIDRSPPARFVGGWVESLDSPVGSGNQDALPVLRPGMDAGRVCRVIEWHRPSDFVVTGSFIDECGTDEKIKPFGGNAPESMGLKPPRCRKIDVPELKNGDVRYVVDVAFDAAAIDSIVPIKVRAPVVKFRLAGSRKNSCGPP